MGNQKNPVVVWILLPPPAETAVLGRVWFQPLLLQSTFGWSCGFPCTSAWGESSAEAFNDAEQSVPEKAHFVPKGMKMLPLTPVCVPNIYKRVDLRCANSFWEYWNCSHWSKTSSYSTCCAVSPTSHTQWMFWLGQQCHWHEADDSLFSLEWLRHSHKVHFLSSENFCVFIFEILVQQATALQACAQPSCIRPLEGTG